MIIENDTHKNWSINEWMKDTLTESCSSLVNIIKECILKNKTMTSNHISLYAIVSRSKPELPVVSACSTLSLPWFGLVCLVFNPRTRVPRQSVWQFYVLPHVRQSGETMISFSAGHIILTPTQTSRERAATAGIKPGTSWPGVARSTDWATAPPPPLRRFLEGFQAGCTLDSRSPSQAQAPLHPLTVLSTSTWIRQFPKTKKSVGPCNLQEPHKSIYQSSTTWIYNLTVHQLSC